MSPSRAGRVEFAAAGAHVVLGRPAGTARALLSLTHGAGGGVDAPDLLAIRDAALARGVAVARILQPYRVLGRRSPPPIPTQDEQWLAAITLLRRRPSLRGLPLILGGRSNGARLACRTANALAARGVVALAFPEHPPGRPDRSRLPELATPDCPVLVVQGERDPFGLPPPAPGRCVHVLAGQGHSFTSRAAVEQAAAHVAGFLEGLVDGPLDDRITR